jgi:hypothetical protein
MKTKHIIRQLAVTALIVTSVCSAFAGEEKEETISMDKVPKAVKATLAKYATESEVKNVEKSDQNGKKVYEFDIEQGTHKFEVAISPKGKFMGTEEDVEFSTLPAAAQKTLQDKAAGGKVSGCEKAVDADGKVTYEGTIEKDGKKAEIAVDADGKVISSESAAEKKEKD